MRHYLWLTVTSAALLLSSISQAGNFLDDFEDGNLQDDNPVSWTAFGGSTINPVAGSMELTPSLPGNASAYVEDFDHENILIEMTFEYTSAASQFVSALFRDRINGMGDVYYAGIFPDGELVIGYFAGASMIAERNVFLETGPINSGDDVTLLVKMIGASITLEAWETAAGRTESKTLSWTDPLNRYPTGTDIGLGFNPLGSPAPILVHSYGVTLIPDCDFSMDGFCDITDLDALIMEIAAGTNNTSFDVTDDGLVDLADRDQWLMDAGALTLPSGEPYLVADFDLDGSVDGHDFLIWNEHKFSSTARWSLGDANGDGTTDGEDFIAWNQHKFTSSDGVGAVPEPEAGLLWMVGLLWLKRTHGRLRFEEPK